MKHLYPRSGIYWPLQMLMAELWPDCAMCQLRIFFGHGHKLADDTVTKEATIRWFKEEPR